LTPRRRAEQALVSVVADAYLAGVSTRRVEKLVQQLGIERLSKRWHEVGPARLGAGSLARY
jgi:transposase-like protein